MKTFLKVAASIVLVLVIGLTAAYLVWQYYVPKYTITGTVTRGGQPLQWKGDNGVLDVKFVPLDRDADPNVYSAKTDRATSSYTIEGIPAGKYRVSIQQMDPYPTHDLLGFAFSMAESPIFKDVTGDGQGIPIDIPADAPRKRNKGGS